MRLKNNELAAVVYARQFGYPLTVSEAKLWAVRKTRQENSQKKLELAKSVCVQLKKIPTIEGIFLTGSVAVNNAKRKADIDLLIVTLPGTLWLTRLIIFLILKKKKIYKNVVCPNIFLDTDHLEIREKNLYTAHEVLQAKCLFDRGNINYLWLKENEWTKGYLPNAYKFRIRNLRRKNLLEIRNWKLKILAMIELIAFAGQYLYQLPRQTNEKLGWGFAFFHPRNLSEKVVGGFERKLKELNN